MYLINSSMGLRHVAHWLLTTVAVIGRSHVRPYNKDLLNNQTSVICQAQTYHPAHSCSHKVAKIFPSYYSREADQICCLDISTGTV